MSTLRTVIVSPNRDAWSETFIRAHIERLPGQVLVLTDGYLPMRFEDGSLIMPNKLIQRIIRSIRLRTGNTWGALHRETVEHTMQAFRPNVVLAEYGPTGAAMLPLCEGIGVPVVVHFHGVDAFSTKMLRKQGNYASLLQRAAAVITVSREMERQLLSLGASRERLHYNCYGIDVERFTTGSPGDAPKRFVAIGRFVEKKAPLLTLKAFHRALQQDPEMQLVMVGEGPLLDACISYVEEHALADAVTFSGVLPHDGVARILRGARAFVQHSIVSGDNDHEGTPLAVLEAMATGIPVIATRHAGIPEVVEHGMHGLLCDEQDIETMSANMLAIARDPQRAMEMGRAGRANVEARYTVEQSIAGLHRILASVAR